MHLLRHTALASVLLVASTLAAAQNNPPLQNVVSLNSSAELEVTYDLLTVTLNATKDGPEAAAVQAGLKQVLDAALAEAKKAAQPGAMDVRTGNFSLYPRYSRDGRISGWQGSAELVLEGKDTQRVAQAAGKLQGMNITNVGYSLSRELREKHETAITAEAIKKYQAKAAEVARQFGFAGYTLREVAVQANEPGFVPRPRMMSMAKGAEAADAALPVEPGKGTITVNVNGSVVLK
jgi:predicted secreted protein